MSDDLLTTIAELIAAIEEAEPPTEMHVSISTLEQILTPEEIDEGLREGWLHIGDTD